MPAKTIEYYLSLAYPVVLIPDPDDGTWYAKIPLLEGCMADGETPSAALAALEEVKQLWFEASLKHDHIIPEPQPLDIVTVELRERGSAEPA